MKHKLKLGYGLSLLTATAALIGAGGPLQAQEKKPNIVMLMQDGTGWNDFGCCNGGAAPWPSNREPRSHSSEISRLELQNVVLR